MTPSGSQGLSTNDSADRPLAGVHGSTHLQARVRGVHVELPLGVADDLAVPRQRSGSAFGLATHGEPFDAHAVDPQIEVLAVAHPDDVVVDLTPQPHFEGVLAVEREVVAYRQAAARSERQVFVDAHVLLQQRGTR